jgi:phosphopantothenoylcysteine decarboxylase/phosphopantothenate--cysteine ligase
MTLTNKNIILGISGSIAAYKAPDIVRRLQDLGAEVRVVLTQNGAQFVTELSLQVTSKNKVYRNLWDKEMALSMGHIELAKWADAILIAPASANTIANLTSGKASDLLGNIILASNCPVLIAPAMNQQMYAADSVQANLKTLLKRQITIIQPENGKQACGDIGEGRLADSTDIAQQVGALFQSTKLSGKKVLITLGATIEAIDPIRYLSNHSSGKMGSAPADACIGHTSLNISAVGINSKLRFRLDFLILFFSIFLTR